MKTKEALAELRSLGTAQNRKVYARHGVTGDCFGVSYANLGALVKRIQRDHELAEALWASGNHDARVLATMIADPTRMSARTLDAWVKQIDNHVLASAFSGVAAKSASARARAEKWTKSRNQWICASGWNVWTLLAQEQDDLPDDLLGALLSSIETTIHQSPNRVRYAMNNALISIGMRNPALEKQAIDAAKRIGVVEVDHGDTSCKTPDAVAYIKKGVAHKRKKAAQASEKPKSPRKASRSAASASKRATSKKRSKKARARSK